MESSKLGEGKQYSWEAPLGEFTTTEKQALSKKFYGIKRSFLWKNMVQNACRYRVSILFAGVFEIYDNWHIYCIILIAWAKKLGR
jgi:hypothetical protein